MKTEENTNGSEITLRNEEHEKNEQCEKILTTNPQFAMKWFQPRKSLVVENWEWFQMQVSSSANILDSKMPTVNS